jgi:hypothetical protein
MRKVPLWPAAVVALLLGLTAPTTAQQPAVEVRKTTVVQQPVVFTATSGSTAMWAKKSSVKTRIDPSSRAKVRRTVRIGYKFAIDKRASVSGWWKAKGRDEWVSKADVTATVSTLWPSKEYARLQAWRHIDATKGWNVNTQYPCIKSLFDKESGWNRYAKNPYSPAYGIPQANPGSKMASIASDWRHNPDTQVRWGLKYLKSRYGSPCGGWSHFKRYGWY